MTHEQRIIFLSYLTNYNINEIYHSYTFESLSSYLEDWNSRHHASKPKGFIEDSLKLSRERLQEMIYNGIKFIHYYHENYPNALRTIYQAPPILYVKGELKQKKNIAIVGTRDASQYASYTVEQYIKELEEGYGVVSGLAVGIDSIAHKMALKYGIYNVAVMASALDTVYPKENLTLANQIISSGGCLISELPIGINRGKKSFVERNRIQTGISDYVAPIELGLKSGTMHTVEFCIRQGKYLLVVQPSKEQSSLPNYEGINYLMRKHYPKRIIVKDSFNLSKITPNLDNLTNPTLF